MSFRISASRPSLAWPDERIVQITCVKVSWFHKVHRAGQKEAPGRLKYTLDSPCPPLNNRFQRIADLGRDNFARRVGPAGRATNGIWLPRASEEYIVGVRRWPGRLDVSRGRASATRSRVPYNGPRCSLASSEREKPRVSSLLIHRSVSFSRAQQLLCTRPIHTDADLHLFSRLPVVLFKYRIRILYIPRRHLT